MRTHAGEAGITQGRDPNAPPRGVLSVGLMGPFYATLDDRPVSLSAGRLRALLAALALSAGCTVSIDRLAEIVWADEDPPGNVRRSLQTYVARLRSALGAEAIGSAPTGYVLYADPEHIDVLRFDGLLGMAAAAPSAATEKALLAQALELWRGRPFEGVQSRMLEEAETPWLLERYLGAVERRLDLDISAGGHGKLVVELSELTARYPLRESLWARLLVALDRSGRRADALARYETVRTRIATELGVDPDPALQRIHADLLARTASRSFR
jgi:DNA-binding SARP family transcriptional activator